MSGIKCIYYGRDVKEDILIDFTDHKVVLGEKPTPPGEDGCRLGGVMSAFSFTTIEGAEDLGIGLIVAARKCRNLRKEGL